MKLSGENSMLFPLIIWNYDSLLEKINTEKFIFGIFVGILMIMFFYNFFIYLSLRDHSYLFYLLYIIGITFSELSQKGIGFEYIWYNYPFVENHSLPFFVPLTLLSACLFTKHFLNIHKYSQKIEWYLNILAFFNFFALIFSFLISYKYSIKLSSIIAMFSVSQILWIGVFSLLKKFKPARYFLIAWGTMLLGMIFYGLRAFGLAPSNFITENGIWIGSVFEVTLLSFALADRINIIKQEKQEAQTESLRIQQEATLNLEIKVNERTHELAEANEKLQELDKLKSNFFANISHEIRTPLTLILSPIESVIQGDYGNKIDKKFFENIQRNAIRLLKLINNLLDFSKIEAGRMNMKIQETDIVSFVKSYVGSIHSAAENKGVNLNFVSLNDSCFLFIDKDKTDKILMNLFSNALKFTDRGGNIKVSVKDDTEHCHIEFTDTGSGIPADKIETIFDRFGQADTSSTRKYEGTGIGLALAKEFTNMHDGSISVQSKYIVEFPHDHGTTFKVTFLKGRDHFENKENIEFIDNEELEESVADHRFAGMREMGDLKTSEVNTSSEIPNGKYSGLINILVVEDNPDMRNFLKFLLQEHYNVHLAVNGEDGFNRTKELMPDLIVSDVMMPIMNGYEMTQKIKEDDSLKRIPVLMLTAKAEIANKIEGLEFGADDYLTKPFNSKELLTRIRSLLKINMLQKELLELNRNLEDRVQHQLNVIMKGDELKRYLPPQLVDSILKGEKHVTFENERKKLTIFFSDIKGFTDTTDSMEAEELSSLLNEYLTEMTKISHKYGGTIDKFIGDAIMIFFGAPESTTEKDQALRCVKMAIEMQVKMRELKLKWFKSGIEYPLEIRIGINTGTATVGNFGAEDRLSYTVIGGQVNLASRLENLADPGGILISHSTWAQIEEEIPCKKRGKVQVKGISREILVYDVLID
jgi:signal transduction histidine kinase/class 3 adenylate cyclase